MPSPTGSQSAADAATLDDSRETLMAAAFSRELTGHTLAFRQDVNRIIDSGIHFAFAWLAFYPEADSNRAGKDPVLQV